MLTYHRKCGIIKIAHYGIKERNKNMNAKRILAVLLVTVMTVSTLFACGGEGGKGNGGKNTLTADECLNKIFENSLPKLYYIY